MMEKSKVLEMIKVTKRFGPVVALKDVSIDLYKGEILGIVGENGAGKSTLMKVLSGSYPSSQYEGKIVIDGNEMVFNSVEDAQRNGIEMCYQEMNMCMDLSVAENLFIGNLPMKNNIVDYKRMYSEAKEMMHKVSINDVDPKTHARFLNPGQMQMMSIMRAYCKHPKILIMDEPSTALTEKEVQVLYELLRGISKEGVSIVYISHKLDEIYALCNRVTVIRDGEVISTRPIENMDRNTMVEEMVGRKIESFYPKEKTEIGKEVLRVEHLTVPHPNINHRNIVENISFSLKEGEILGIGGLVGSGRSEALGSVYGQYTHNVSKEIYINGKKVEINSPTDAIKNGIGFLTEERKLNGLIPTLSIKDNISLASLAKLSNKGIINRSKEEEICTKEYTKLRIKAPSIKTVVNQLSGGNQQKVILGKWLMNMPRILFMDEPTKGIDVGSKADIYRIMNEMTRQGISIIMVSSDMPELISMSDRILVIAGGKITAELTGDQISEVNIMNAAI